MQEVPRAADDVQRQGGEANVQGKLSAATSAVLDFAAHLGAAFANGRSELERAAEADEKLRKGLPIFFGSMGAFLLLACVTFCRVRRRGGRKAPPRLEFSAVPPPPCE